MPSEATKQSKAKQSKRALHAHKQDGCTQSIASYMITEQCGILWLEATSPGSMQLPRNALTYHHDNVHQTAVPCGH
jgi:hypothetical protein